MRITGRHMRLMTSDKKAGHPVRKIICLTSPRRVLYQDYKCIIRQSCRNLPVQQTNQSKPFLSLPNKVMFCLAVCLVGHWTDLHETFTTVVCRAEKHSFEILRMMRITIRIQDAVTIGTTRQMLAVSDYTCSCLVISVLCIMYYWLFCEVCITLY